MDGKSDEWRAAAHDLLVALARDNKYIVSDILIVFLESAGYGLKEYSVLGGVFKRAAKAGIIKRIEQPKASKQSLWISCIYDQPADLTDHQARVVKDIDMIVKLGIRAAGYVDLTDDEVKEVLKAVSNENL